MVQSKLELIIGAVDKASSVLGKVETNVKGLEKTNTTMGQKLSASFKQIASSSAFAGVSIAGATTAVALAFKKSMEDYSDYVTTVDKFAMATGASAEEASKLIQVADDFRVETAALEQGMKLALQNGFNPTIENMAKLSDEFLSIQDPIKRAEMMQKIFGKSWQELIPLLEQGGSAIREAADEMTGGLVVTEEAIEANRKFYEAQDKLNDSFTSLKYSVMNDAMPAVTAFIDVLSNGFTPDAAANFINTLYEGTVLESEWSRNARAAAESAEAAAKATSGWTTELYSSYRGLADGQQPIEDFVGSLMTAETAMKSYSDMLLYTMASEGMSEKEKYDLALAMGLVDEQTVRATRAMALADQQLKDGTITNREYRDRVIEIQQAMEGLKDKSITVTTNFITNGEPWEGLGISTETTVEARANGGPINAGQPYWVGERGPELVVPGQSGVVIPNGNSTSITNNFNQTIRSNSSSGAQRGFNIMKTMMGA